MTITLELPDSLGARLVVAADAEGVTPSDVATQLIADAFGLDDLSTDDEFKATFNSADTGQEKPTTQAD